MKKKNREKNSVRFIVVVVLLILFTGKSGTSTSKTFLCLVELHVDVPFNWGQCSWFISVIAMNSSSVFPFSFVYATLLMSTMNKKCVGDIL